MSKAVKQNRRASSTSRSSMPWRRLSAVRRAMSADSASSLVRTSSDTSGGSGAVSHGGARSLPHPPDLHLEQHPKPVQLSKQVLKRGTISVHRRLPAYPSERPRPKCRLSAELTQVGGDEVARVRGLGEVAALAAWHVRDPPPPGRAA